MLGDLRRLGRAKEKNKKKRLRHNIVDGGEGTIMKVVCRRMERMTKTLSLFCHFAAPSLRDVPTHFTKVWWGSKWLECGTSPHAVQGGIYRTRKPARNHALILDTYFYTMRNNHFSLNVMMDTEAEDDSNPVWSVHEGQTAAVWRLETSQQKGLMPFPPFSSYLSTLPPHLVILSWNGGSKARKRGEERIVCFSRVDNIPRACIFTPHY